MGIQDRKLDRRGVTAIKEFLVNFVTSTTQSDVKVWQYQPPYSYEVVGVEVYTLDYTATASVNVKINGTSVLTGAITPADATVVKGVMKTDIRACRGTPSQPLQVHYTTNGSGIILNAQVLITLRKTSTGGYSG